MGIWSQMVLPDCRRQRCFQIIDETYSITFIAHVKLKLSHVGLFYTPPVLSNLKKLESSRDLVVEIITNLAFFIMKKDENSRPMRGLWSIILG